MLVGVALAVLVTFSSTVTAYNDNCDGSLFSPGKNNCLIGISTVDPKQTYTDNYQFSHGNCFLLYHTKGSGDQPLDGKTIINTANAILDTCHHFHGSFGTGNCDECHVTVNFRVDPLDDEDDAHDPDDTWGDRP